MLVLTRKPQQSIRIGNDITVNIVRVRGNTVQIGIEAPKEINILRSELVDKPKQPEASQQAPAIHQTAEAKAKGLNSTGSGSAGSESTELNSKASKNSVEEEESETEMECFRLELFQGPEDFDSPLQQFMFAP